MSKDTEQVSGNLLAETQRSVMLKPRPFNNHALSALPRALATIDLTTAVTITTHCQMGLGVRQAWVES